MPGSIRAGEHMRGAASGDESTQGKGGQAVDTARRRRVAERTFLLRCFRWRAWAAKWQEMKQKEVSPMSNFTTKPPLLPHTLSAPVASHAFCRFLTCRIVARRGWQ